MSSNSESSGSGSDAKRNIKKEERPLANLALSKSSFQQMLMNFNNKVVTPTPVKPSTFKKLKASEKHHRDSLDSHSFNPPASSTLNPFNEFTDSLDTSSKKHKKRKDSASSSFIEEDEKPKKKKKKRKRDVSASDNDESLTTATFDADNTPKKIKLGLDESSTSQHLHNYSNDFNVTIKKKKAKRDLSESNDFKGSSGAQESGTSAKMKILDILDKFQDDNRLVETEDVPRFSKDITSSRYESFLIQVPKSIDPKQLIGFELSLSDQARIKLEGVRYDCIPTTCKEPATLLNNNVLNTVYPKANIVIKQHIKQKQLPDVTGTLNNGVAFPNDLKERHPLFGADYLDNITLEQHIRNKLKAAIQSNKLRLKKEKETAELLKQEKKGEAVQPQDEEIFKLLNQSAAEILGKKTKKDKKKKERDADDNNMINEILYSKSLEISSSSGDKKKKHKKHLS